MSMDALEEQIGQNLVLDEYLGRNIDFDAIEVTEEELKDYYDELAEVQDLGDASFDEVKPKLEQQLRDEKAGVEIEALIAELREDSDIEYKIEF